MTSSIHPCLLRVALVNALFCAWAARADALPPTTVALRTTRCTSEQHAALRRALEVELETLNIEPDWDTGDAGLPARITLRAECDVEGQSATLRIWSSVPQLVLSRAIALRDVAEPARARTLALVISEALGPALASNVDEAALIEADEPVERPRLRAQTAQRPPARVASRGRRGSAFVRTDPYDSATDELFTTSNPYGMQRAFRIAASGQGRIAARDRSVLFALELATSGPLSDHADWGIEFSHTSSTTWTSEREVSWWNVAIGADLVDMSELGLAIGPRLWLGHLSINDPLQPESAETTLVSQLGARGKLEVPLGERTTMQVTLSAQRTLGVQALTSYTGLDEGLNGWLFSSGLGLGFEP